MINNGGELHWDDEISRQFADVKKIEETSQFISRQIELSYPKPELAIICGSGLSNLTAAMSPGAITICYGEIPNFPHSTIKGHENEMAIGELNGVHTVCLHGRFHFYEGHSLNSAVFPVRVLAHMGVKKLLVTNSAGAINPLFKVGDIMVIEDHISFLNLAGISPLRGSNNPEVGPRFPSLINAYHPASYDVVFDSATKAGISKTNIKRGVYVNVGGPTYETPAEIRFMRRIGGDAVGMSTVPEVVAAVHCGMKVIGLSFLTNISIHDRTHDNGPNHEEVLAVSQMYAKTLEGLVYHLAKDIVKLK